MTIGAINNDRGVLGATSFSGQAAVLGRAGGAGDFESELKRSFGLGAKSDSSLPAGLAPADSSTGDLIGQLQYSLLKNNSGASGQLSRVAGALF
ncbi:MAG: hypothetical protein LBP55_03935 [Candidatus Adiutrix sp.]|jgi:hypothetical protein|nr:hypothetical protein [Candidatus Adiutrix sp.]